jgi:hypothetical protein
MKIFAFERELPEATKELFALHAKEEARTVWELYQAGVIRELYFHAEQHTAVLVLECASTEEAGGILSGLPYVGQGLIAFDLVPLAPYPGFARLFAAE